MKTNANGGAPPQWLIDAEGRLAPPVVALLHQALKYRVEPLRQTRWRPVRRVPRDMNAITIYRNVYYSEKRARDWRFADWFHLIVHEQFHREEIGDELPGALRWYAAYAAGWARAGFSYRENPFEARAYAAGCSSQSLAAELVAFRNGEALRLLRDDRLTVAVKTHRLAELGKQFNGRARFGGFAVKN